MVADGFARTRLLFDTSLREDTRVDAQIKPAMGVVTGRVVDADGEAVPLAKVRVRTSGNILALRGLAERADEAGRFTYIGVGSERTLDLMAASAPGYEEASIDARPDVLDGRPIVVTLEKQPEDGASAAEPVEPQRSVSPLRDLAGRVVDGGGQPVADARLRWSGDPYGRFVEPAEADAEGRFSFDRIPAVDGVLVAEAPGFARRVVRMEGDAKETTVRLDVGRGITGRVVDASGKPVDDVWVLPITSTPWSHLCGQDALRGRSTRTDADGRFTLKHLPPDVTFTFLKAGFSDRRGVRLAFDRSHEIKMLAGGAVRGRVVGPDGRPVERFVLTFGAPRHREPGDRVGGFFAGYSWPGVTFTDADGRFQVTDLTAGSVVSVTATASGLSAGEVDYVRVLPITAIGDDNEITINLTPAVSMNVAVVALEEGGDPTPVSDAKITFLAGHNGRNIDWAHPTLGWRFSQTETTGDEGVAAFGDMPYDRGAILVQADGFARRSLPWSREAGPMIVELEPEATIAGVARWPDGEPLLDGWVKLRLTIQDEGDFEWQWFSKRLRPEDEGRFAFDRLAPGAYAIAADQQQPRSFSQQIALEPGQAIEDESVEVGVQASSLDH
ncbi:MAG: carboxypeptidase regulatory-like domain-containing protein [Planctomycetota bacterium]